MAVGKRRQWSRQDIAVLEKHAGKLTIAQIAERLGRSENSVRSHAQRFGLSLAVESADAHDAWLCCELYKEGLSIAVIAEKMELSRRMVSNIVFRG